MIKTGKKSTKVCSLRFQEAEIDDFLSVLDAVVWTNCPDLKQISQFANLDPKVTAKLLANGLVLGLLDSFDGELFSLVTAYPFKGSQTQKRRVVQEALLRMPLIVNVLQFLSLEEPLEVALRKAASVQRVENFDAKELAPLLAWCKELKVLEPGITLEDFFEDAAAAKVERNEKHPKKRVVFLSRSSKDNPMIRQLATDLTAEGVTVWLHEQRVRGVETISKKLAQGLVESDFFLLGLSRAGVSAPWIKQEFNQSLVDEVAVRGARLVSLKLSECDSPSLLIKHPSIDFSISYKTGLKELLLALRQDLRPAGESDLSLNNGIVSPGTVVVEK
jgi:hypothetical protein